MLNPFFMQKLPFGTNLGHLQKKLGVATDVLPLNVLKLMQSPAR